MTTADDIAVRIHAIESAFVTQWRHFGEYPGAELHDEDGVLRYESPIPHLPYNAVIRTRIPSGRDADAVVRRVVERYAEHGVPFMWVVRPSDTPYDVGERLAAAGLDLVEEATGMDLELTAETEYDEPGPGVEVVTVETGQQLSDYETLIRAYWSVPDAQRPRIQALSRHFAGDRSPGPRYVAYVDGAPVGKTLTNLLELPVVGVYGVAVVDEARGRGVASALMWRALADARERGATRAVLHSSPMAVSLYRRMGFVDRCTYHVYATAALFGTHQH